VLLSLILPLAIHPQEVRKAPEIDEETRKRMGPLDSVIYKKEYQEEYRKELERERRLREMEAWDGQRRLVKRQIMNVHCTWKFPSGKTVTKTFERRIAPSCEEALKELSSDLKKPLTADCSCKGSSPKAENP
jgi:hypothetical protein